MCKLSESENYNQEGGKAEERGRDVEVVEGERTGEEIQRPERMGSVYSNSVPVFGSLPVENFE